MNIGHISKRLLLVGAPLAALAIGLIGSAAARADLIVAVGSTSAAAGSNDQFVDVTLENTGGSDITVESFSFDFSTSNTFVTFTSADISTVDPYIFAGNSLFGPVISTTSPGQSITASDLDAAGGAIVAAHSTVGLGEVLFNIAPDATSGIASLVLDGAGTSLSDVAGANIPITTLIDGQITITTGATVPEPSLLAPLALLFAAAALLRRRQRA
jgi:hypothetical protein